MKGSIDDNLREGQGGSREGLSSKEVRIEGTSVGTRNGNVRRVVASAKGDVR